MKWVLALLAAASVCLAADGRAAKMAGLIRETSLDPDECYQVRDLSLVREDIRIFLTDGFLIFGKPVNGRHYSAVFVTREEIGDAELLVFAPNRGERLALATYTGSPTLNEHFKVAVMLFADDTYGRLMEQVRSHGEPRKSPERGILLEQEWNPVFRNLAASFEIRLVKELLEDSDPSLGFFYTAITGNRLGNFDVIYDPRAQVQITIGKVAFRDSQAFFDVWTSFQSRQFRNGANDAAPPEFQLSNFRVEATLEPDLRLKAKTKVIVTPAVKLEALAFDLSRRMHVSEAFVDGAPAEVFQRASMRSNLIENKRGDDVFLLIPPAALEPGRQYEVEFRHEGAVVSEAGNRVYYVGSRGNWYPNEPGQFARYDVTFRYPRDLDLVASGEIEEQRTEGEWSITRRTTSSPVRFFGFNLGDYERVTVKGDRYTVEVCANRQVEDNLRPAVNEMVIVPPTGWPRSSRRGGQILTVPVERRPPNPAARLHVVASEIASALEFMAEHFGPPPLKQVTISPIPGAFGQGFPGLVYLSTLSYLAPEDRPKETRTEYHRLFFSEILQAHETAHQWWGNVVTAASYRDEWLMEALANYSALLYLEKSKGNRVLESILAEYKRNLLAQTPGGRTVESAGPIVWGFRLNSSQTPGAWRTITYEKGSWILHMLRRRMGDERFLGMLGELRRRYEYHWITTEQFRLLAAEFLPPHSVDSKLEGFFDNWVYSTGIPSLQLRSSVRGKPPAVKVSGKLMQTEVGNDFNIYVPVVIQPAKGPLVTKWLETDSVPVEFEVTLRAMPLKVALDPMDSVLAVRK